MHIYIQFKIKEVLKTPIPLPIDSKIMIILPIIYRNTTHLQMSGCLKSKGIHLFELPSPFEPPTSSPVVCFNHSINQLTIDHVTLKLSGSGVQILQIIPSPQFFPFLASHLLKQENYIFISALGKIQKKKVFCSDWTTKVLPSLLHQWLSGPCHFFFFFFRLIIA